MSKILDVHGIFPQSETGEERLRRVGIRWDFSTGFPLPKWNWACPVCGHEQLYIYRWVFFEQEFVGAGPFLCDVHAKCHDCSAALPPFGVLVPEEVYRRMNDTGEHRSYHWREAREMLQS